MYEDELPDSFATRVKSCSLRRSRCSLERDEPSDLLSEKVSIVRACNFGAPDPLQIWAQPRGAAVALGELRQCSCGSVAAAIVWLAASVLFSWYVANFGSYKKTYGSLAAIIGFMTWIWISIIVVLVGAKLSAEMERQTARDTTTGRPKPLGARGAQMADTVGAA